MDQSNKGSHPKKRFFGKSFPNMGGCGGWFPNKVQTPFLTRISLFVFPNLTKTLGWLGGLNRFGKTFPKKAFIFCGSPKALSLQELFLNFIQSSSSLVGTLMTITEHMNPPPHVHIISGYNTHLSNAQPWHASSASNASLNLHLSCVHVIQHLSSWALSGKGWCISES